jgi:hypothetical protein
MPEPTLHQVRRHQRLKRIHAKAVAQSLWHGWRTRNMGRRHDFLDPPPCCRSAPFPDPPRGRIWIVLTSPKMEGVIELTDNVPGQGDLPDHAALAAFQRHNVYNAAVDVDCCRCDGEDFGNPAASQT